MKVNADLHIHSCFSMASSPGMVPPALIGACVKKGISVLGSGDALHPGWRQMWAEHIENDAGVLIIPTTEVEDKNRVHHLIVMADFAGFSELNSMLLPFSKDIMSGGRPHVRLAGHEIAGMVHDLDGLIGPAHAFTPWTSLYASFNRVGECYGQEKIDFLELGLSADNSYGAAISDLEGIPFVTNSDAHSPDPAKCGREFTSFDIRNNTVEGFLASLRSGRITMNIGFFPEEGKYNKTACTRCFEQYSPGEATRYHMRCPKDRGIIKKGVSDRARELSDGVPSARPPYLHMIPLGEIIKTTLKVSSTHTKKCLSLYEEFIGRFGNEIEVLIQVPLPELREVHEGVGDSIDALRSGRVLLHPGGGGMYGTFTLLPPGL